MLDVVPSMRRIVTATVCSRGGAQQKLEIIHARKEHIDTLVRIYNSVLDPQYEAGLAVERRHMESRLQYDPESVFLALLNGEPCALINVAKKRLDASRMADEMPRTHQILTDNDELTTTDPDNGNVWFCPWVAVEIGVRRLKGTVDGKLRSVGQILARAVAREALGHQKVEELFAYSRPGSLRSAVNQLCDNRLEVDMIKEPPYISATFLGEEIDLTKKLGPFLKNENTYLIEFPRYAVGRTDAALTFHEKNGADILDVELILAMGNPKDGNSLGYRWPARYPLRQEF